MLELRLAGIHDDGENLILESADGTTYLLPIDQNLRQSIARARRINPLRGGSNGTFGPREIQTRFRQGATVEEIAAESGWDPNRVRRYEWPIVAERANIIHTARAVMISPAPGQGGGKAQNLNQHIEQVSGRYGFGEAPMDWSTWQQESGQWTVSLDVSLTDEVLGKLPPTVMFPARWNFNPANQSIYASNEAAYFLMGRDHSQDSSAADTASSQAQSSTASPAQEPSTQESSLGVQVASPRVTAVRVPQNKEHNELLDELASRRGVRSFDPASERKLADLLERARRGSHPVGELHDTPASNSQSDLAPQVAEEELTPAPVSSREDAASVDSQAVVQDPLQDQAGKEQLSQAPAAEEKADESSEEVPEASSSQVGDAKSIPSTISDQNQEPAEGAKQPGDDSAAESEAKAKPARGKRTSVPSWDDIIFGNQRR